MGESVRTPFGFRLSPLRFSKAFIGSRARRYIQEFLDAIGPANLKYLIEHQKTIEEYLPPQYREQLQGGWHVQQQYLKMFTEQDVYGWFPEDYRTFFESLPGGKEWVFRHIELLKRIIIPT